MRALVTGCAGFVGSHLTESLLDDGSEVVGVDCFNDNYGRAQKLANLRHIADWDSFEFVPIDLARGDLEELLSEVEVVFHLAAEPGVRSSWGLRFERYVQNNIVATQHLLEAVKHRPEVRFVFGSSSSVYGSTEIRPTPEEAPTRPLSPYGLTKLGAEHLCHLYGKSYGLDFVILRYFTVFGPRQRPDMAFHVFCRAALQGRPVTIYGDGLQTRDFTYVDDAVAATKSAATATLNNVRVYNVGGGSPTSLREAVELIGTLAGKRLEVQHRAPEQGDVRDTAADTSRAREELGFVPRTSLREGLVAELEWIPQAIGGARAS
jgi:UDP-glucuronate 4-epimerase